MRTHIIHTNEIDVSFGSYDAAEEAAREALLEDHGEKEVTDDMIWRWIYDSIEISASDFWYAIGRVQGGPWLVVANVDIGRVQGGPWLVVANVDTWRGRVQGGRVFDSLSQAVSAICNDMDYVTIAETGHGNVHAACVHHDGRNHFDVYRLSERGKVWYENHGNHLDWQTICETLAKPHNRRAAHLRRELGWAA